MVQFLMKYNQANQWWFPYPEYRFPYFRKDGFLPQEYSLTDISKDYIKESIENQIEKGIHSKISRSENRTPRIVGSRKNYRIYIPRTPYQKAFFAKMYRTGQLKRKPYSQMWKYREEATRFEKLRSQYLYLCRYNIPSVEGLKDRKEDINICMDALDEQRHQIYKRRYLHKPALALLKIIEENEMRASYYKEGSTFYAPNYEIWKESTEILIGKGYTVNQITEIKEVFQRELALITKAKRELRKEENLINDILGGNNRVQIVEKISPMLEAKENTKEADSIQNEISTEKKTLRKGGDAEKAEETATEIPAQTETDHFQNRPAHNDKQKQPERAR